MLVKTVRGIRLATTAGVIRMAPGTTRDLQGEYLRLALEKGATPTNEVNETVPYAGAKYMLEDEVEMTEDERFAADPTVPRADRVIAAVRTLIERNDPSVLTRAGIPRVRDVASLVGDEVSRDEIELAVSRVT